MSTHPSIFYEIQQQWAASPYGSKAETINKWAEMLKCSPHRLYGKINTGRKRQNGDSLIEQAHVKAVFQIKKKPPEQLGEISTDQAVMIAIQSGLIPESLKNQVPTINRIGRMMGLNKKKRRITRYQAEYPNQLHHVDASSSRCFYVERKLPDGDYLLKLHAGKKGYKNKPVPIRLRPWVYSLVDDYSGYYIGRYVVAYGESADDNMIFLAWAWSKNDDKPFYGLSNELKGDFGPMMRSKAFQNFIERLGLKINPSKPENKESHGKIERRFRTCWQRFEKPFFAQTDWKKFKITLSELNRQFLIFQEGENNRSHRFEKDITRLQAWKRINLKGGATALPDDVLSKVINIEERVVGADGCFTIDNVWYEVKGLHDANVYVYRGVFDDRIVVEDKETGMKYETEKFTPNPVGVYTVQEDTPHQKIVKEAQNLEIDNKLHESPKDKGNVTHFPIKTKQVRTIEDPLNVNSYLSLNEAVQDFISMSNFVPKGDDLKYLKNLIIKNGLDRNYVRDIAFKIQAELERREVNA